MIPIQLEPTFLVCRSSLHQLCCEEASRSERRYHISKHLLFSLATEEEINAEEPDSDYSLVFLDQKTLITERVQKRVFPQFFGGLREAFQTDDHTDGVPRLCNALDFVTGFIRPEGTKLFSGITYFFKTTTPMVPGRLKLITTRPALAVGLRAVLVNPVQVDVSPVEIAVTTSACVEIKPKDVIVEIGYES